MVKTLGVVGAMLAVAHVAWAEQVEIVTYYPSPAAATDDLKVKRAAVGSTYQALNFDDALAAVADGTLLVEHGLGIGTTTLHNNGLTSSGQPGILDVQDIWLRGANAWASEVGGGAPPTPPYTVYIPVELTRESRPSGDSYWRIHSGGLDLYQALGLWRAGVTQNEVTMVGWRGCMTMSGGTGFACDQTRIYWPGSTGTGGASWVTPRQPAFYRGTILTPWDEWAQPTFPGAGVPLGYGYEVTVTWPTD